jgi:hypothetical protein
MITLNEKQVHDFRVSGYDLPTLIRMLGKTNPLVKIEQFLYAKTGIHLGETLIIKNSFRDKYNRLVIFPKTQGTYQIFPGSDPNDTWFTSIVGYEPKTKRFVICKCFRGAGTALSKKHFILPDIRFLKRMR